METHGEGCGRATGISPLGLFLARHSTFPTQSDN